MTKIEVLLQYLQALNRLDKAIEELEQIEVGVGVVAGVRYEIQEVVRRGYSQYPQLVDAVMKKPCT